MQKCTNKQASTHDRGRWFTDELKPPVSLYVCLSATLSAIKLHQRTLLDETYQVKEVFTSSMHQLSVRRQ